MKLIGWLALVLSLSLYSFDEGAEAYKTITYSLGEASTLKVNGKTNINNFSCVSTENVGRQELRFRQDGDALHYQFLQTKLDLAVNMLDCGNRAITRDLRKALEADTYPYITLTLYEATNMDGIPVEECDSWVNFQTTVDLAIGKTCQLFTTSVRVQKIDNGRLRCQGEITIELTEFDIDPPTALAGLIKVRNQIEIEFDLYIELPVTS